MICPHCAGRTEVLETAQRGQITRRRRRCVECEKRFSTLESIVGHEKPSAPLVEILAHKSRPIEPDVLKAMLNVDRRKAKIAREHRDLRYDEDQRAPRSLRGDALRRELKGY